MSDTKVYNPKDFQTGSVVEISFNYTPQDGQPRQYQIESLKQTPRSSCDFLVQMRELIVDKETGVTTLSTDLEEFNPYWISKTIKQGTGGVKWSINYLNPGLYPAGTLVRAKNLPGSYGNDELKNKIYVVKGLVVNGVNSYCIVTTEPDPCEQIGGNHSFNISHVSEIVKRGDGKMVWLHDRKSTPYNPWVKQAFFFLPKIKTSHLVYDLEDAVIQSLWFKDLDEVYIDTGKLKAQLFQQSWVRLSQFRQVGNVFVVNKKRLKRWLAQNLNRFKQKKVIAEREYDEMMSVSYADIVDDWGDHGK